MQNRSFIIRLGEAHDLPCIQTIVEQAYSPYIKRMAGQKPGPMLDDYALRIAQQQLYILSIEATLAGILVLIEEPDDQERMLLDNIALDPAYQGQGLSTALLDFAEQTALKKGYSALRLYTHTTMHENIALYQKRGFVITGEGAQAGYERVFMHKSL